VVSAFDWLCNAVEFIERDEMGLAWLHEVTRDGVPL
jgi:hypothetical protein